MDATVILSSPTAADGNEFIASVQASRDLHRPWIDPPDSPTRYGEYVARVASGEVAAYLIRHTECGRLVGFVNVSNMVRRSFLSATIGYGAFAGHAGRGLMTKGLAAVVDDAFGPLGLHRLEANIQPGNRASIALVRRLGFTLEGFSARFLMVDGDWRDHERWAIRSEQWASGG